MNSKKYKPNGKGKSYTSAVVSSVGKIDEWVCVGAVLVKPGV